MSAGGQRLSLTHLVAIGMLGGFIASCGKGSQVSPATSPPTTQGTNGNTGTNSSTSTSGTAASTTPSSTPGVGPDCAGGLQGSKYAVCGRLATAPFAGSNGGPTTVIGNVDAGASGQGSKYTVTGGTFHAGN